MHLRFVLLMAVATLAATSTVVAAQVSNGDGIASLDTLAGQESSRFLRTADTKTTENETSPKFLEHKLQKALSNPKKTNKLYQYWNKKGYTAKEVASNLGQTENRELSRTYKTLARGYVKYLKTQSAL